MVAMVKGGEAARRAADAQRSWLPPYVDGVERHRIDAPRGVFAHANMLRGVVMRADYCGCLHGLCVEDVAVYVPRTAEEEAEEEEARREAAIAAAATAAAEAGVKHHSDTPPGNVATSQPDGSVTEVHTIRDARGTLLRAARPHELAAFRDAVTFRVYEGRSLTGKFVVAAELGHAQSGYGDDDGSCEWSSETSDDDGGGRFGRWSDPQGRGSSLTPSSYSSYSYRDSAVPSAPTGVDIAGSGDRLRAKTIRRLAFRLRT